MGAPLARLEGRVALEMPLERFAEIGFADERPRFRHRVVLPGLRLPALRCTDA